MSLDIRKLLKSVVAYKASDLHLVSRSEPQIRIDGKLVSLNLPVMDGTMIEDMSYSLLTDKQKKEFEEELELAHAGMAVTLTLEDEIDISRGDMLAHPHNVPRVSNRAEAMLVWMQINQTHIPS